MSRDWRPLPISLVAHVTTIVVNISIDTADAKHTSEAREVGFDMSQHICLTSGFDKRLLVSAVAVVVRFGFDSRLAVSTVTVRFWFRQSLWIRAGLSFL